MVRAARLDRPAQVIPLQPQREVVLPPPPDLRDPSNGKKIVAPAWMPNAEVKEILSASSTAQKEWAKVPFAERARLMNRAAEILLERKDDFAKMMAREMGKPLADGRAEIEKCASVCRFYADNTESFLAPRPVATDAKKSLDMESASAR